MRRLNSDRLCSRGSTNGRFIAVLFGGIAVILFMAIAPLGLAFGGLIDGTRILLILPLVLPFVILTVVAVLVWSSMTDSTPDTRSEDSLGDPLEVLERRYLDGDISIDTYETKLDRVFELESGFDADPQLKRLAIQYARGESTRAKVESQIDSLDSPTMGSDPDDVDRLLIAMFGESDPPLVRLRPDRTDDAVQRLRTRYADGKLTDEEYKRRLALLRETEDTDWQS